MIPLLSVSGWTERSHVQDAWDSWVFSWTLWLEVKYSQIFSNQNNVNVKQFLIVLSLPALHLPIFTAFAVSHPSGTQLSDMSENEDMLLEFFVTLPQLKQVTSDKEELVTNIVDMASKFLFWTWTGGLNGQSWKTGYI